MATAPSESAWSRVALACLRLVSSRDGLLHTTTGSAGMLPLMLARTMQHGRCVLRPPPPLLRRRRCCRRRHGTAAATPLA